VFSVWLLSALILTPPAAGQPEASLDADRLGSGVTSEPNGADKKAKSADGLIHGKLIFAERNQNGEWAPRKKPLFDGYWILGEPKKTAASTPNNKPPLQSLEEMIANMEFVKSTVDYIGSPNDAAVWQFTQVPASLAQREQVTVRFSADIYPVVRFFEGVAEIDLVFVNQAKWTKSRAEAYRKARTAKSSEQTKPAQLAQQFGMFELGGVQIARWQKTPFSVTFPGALLDGLRESTLEIRVQCRTPGVYLGFAPDDLVILSR
jgi:hypothetical protein